MRRNCHKNSCRSGSTPPTNADTLLPCFANLLTKARIKYGVTGSVRVRVRVMVSVNIKLFILHFVDLYLLYGATVVSTDPLIALRWLRNRPMLALTIDQLIAQIHCWRTTLAHISHCLIA